MPFSERNEKEQPFCEHLMSYIVSVHAYACMYVCMYVRYRLGHGTPEVP